MKQLKTLTPPPRKLTALLAVVMAAMTIPAMAQVPGVVGSAACTAGASQKNDSALTRSVRPVVTDTSVTFTHSNIQGAYYLSQAPGSSYPYTLYYAIRKADGTGGVSNNLIGNVASASTTFNSSARTLQSRSPLTPNTNYVLSVHADTSAFNNASWPSSARIGTRICFKTGPSASQMSRSLGWYNDVQRFASGCFAFGGNQEQVKACLCGARNLSGQWRETNGDGFNWQISAAERTRLGCSTN